MTGASHSGRVCKKCNNRITYGRYLLCYDCYRARRIKNGYWSNKSRTYRWHKLRTEAFSVIGNRCWRCRRVFAKKKLQLHHLHYGNIGKETLNDVLLLCQACHSYKHREMKAARERAENLDQS